MVEDFFVKTGIPGVDKIAGGGFTPGSVVTLSGTPGVGKTIFCLQYIYNGAKNGEPGAFISTEETADMIRYHVKCLGWKGWDELEKKGLIKVLQPDILKPGPSVRPASFEGLMEQISELDVKRFAFDSMNTIKLFFGDERGVRTNIFHFISHIKNMGMTSLITSESPEPYPNMYFGPEYFLSDGVMILFFSRLGSSMERCFWFMKMRGQNLMTDIYPMTIDTDGIKVYPGKKPFSLERAVIPQGQFR
jgi:KaiC/GvpD/RAD55 family RecA-like ATPase